ncbi:PEGA domain-containing protein [Corallococcus macrosporus]|uniref:Lipoprotein n=1 Tax=Corallococcus macrosporus DSM 14697 TaxID=1189310 RepID=A0A250JWM4_9BACT|nr:PEGA domain-containing protein [Corallococcus macrosporus]ATB47907.1 lipoprotein [Corallococcus macrosporus DSM 14697]
MRKVLLWVAVSTLAGCAKRQEPESLLKARELMAEAQSPSGNLALVCEPTDAEVYLDGVWQGLCSDFNGSPKALRVGTGLHEIEVKKRGYWPYTTYFEPSRARARLTIQLRANGASGGGAE